MKPSKKRRLEARAARGLADEWEDRRSHDWDAHEDDAGDDGEEMDDNENEVEEESKNGGKSSSDSDSEDGANMSSLKKRRKSKAERDQARAKKQAGQTSISGASLKSQSAVNGGELRSFQRKFWLGPPGEDPPSDALKKMRQEIGVNVKGSLTLCPAPEPDVKSPNLPPSFAAMFAAYRLTRPTAIQQQCWPALLSGANLLGLAPTGSGKTLAYGLPMIPHIAAQLPAVSPKRGQTVRPLSLVLTPTRELAIQVAKVFKQFRKAGNGFNISASAVYGGEDRAKQLEELLSGGGAHIIVGTPGRLLDLLSHGDMSLDQVTYLVIDEADRMLALGFQEQISTIATHIRQDRQTALFSATFPGKLRELAAQWAPEAVLVRCSTMEVSMPARPPKETEVGGKHDKPEKESAVVNKTDNSSSISANASATGGNSEQNADFANDGSSSLTVSSTIHQSVHVCASHKKPRLLIRYISKIREAETKEKARQPGALLIFCTKIKTLSFVMDFLRRQNVKGVYMLHGNMAQSQREQVLNDFRAGKIHTLCSTDVAARGIHVKRLKYVFNYDFPGTLEQYCHRVGRTGRQGESGEAFSLMTRNMAPLASGLISLLKSCGQPVEPNLLALAEDFKAGHWEFDEKEEGGTTDSASKAEEEDWEADPEPTSKISEKNAVVSKGDSFLDDT